MAPDQDLDLGPPPPPGSHTKRPSLGHRDSDSHSDSTIAPGAPTLHHRPKKQHHVGRLHARVPSSKAIYKQLANPTSPAPALTSAKPARRSISPYAPDQPQRRSHRRATSEVKLPTRSSASNLLKSASHTNLQPNRSQNQVGEREQAADKQRSASIHRDKPVKTQVHFDLGSDDPEGEWVDASSSNSPYLSRKGSLNSSRPSSLRPGSSYSGGGPQQEASHEPLHRQPPPSPRRETSYHNEYLTSRLLQRTPTMGAPPKMTVDSAQAAPPHPPSSPFSANHSSSPLSGNANDELTSRFVDTLGSGITSEGSFYHPSRLPPSRPDRPVQRPDPVPKLDASPDEGNATPMAAEDENSALVPRPAMRTVALPAESSRTQQKLNLQRASSVLDPGQAMAAVGGIGGPGPLLSLGGAAFDGANSSRDHRLGKVLERTGMEYLVVRRYQNPVARSLNRILRPLDTGKTRRIPLVSAMSMNGKRPSEFQGRHARNVSMPDPRPPLLPRRTPSTRTVAAPNSSLEGDGTGDRNEGLSGTSLVDGAGDAITALLRNLWEKPTELSGSVD